ncbi:MAG: HEAT repeat domain-containing protein [Planctomycetota bacterium]
MSVLATLLILAALVYVIRQLLKPPAWASIAPDLGLTATRRGIDGFLDGWQVEVRKTDDFKIAVGPVTPGFSVQPAVLGQRFLNPGLSIGDERFDEEVLLEGDRSFALALLRPDVRASLLHLIIGQGGSVSDGWIRTQVERRSLVVEMVPLLIELAGQLRQPELTDLAPQVREVATSDDTPSVRRVALLELCDVLYGSDEAIKAARALRHEPDPELRREAAFVLLHSAGEYRGQGVEMVKELLLMPNVPEEERLSTFSSFSTLIWRTDSEAMLPVLEAVLEAPTSSVALRQAVIHMCQRIRALELLLRFAVDSEAEWLQVIEALSEIEDPGAQPRLLEGLDQGERRVRIAALKALRKLGDVDAIPALAVAREGTEDRKLLRAIDKALIAIQHRTGVFQSGELSVVQTEPLEGALSQTEASEGAVSLEDQSAMEAESQHGPTR